MRIAVFDVELIIDHRKGKIRGKDVYISTHRLYRCLSLKQLNDLVKENQAINLNDERITFNIRGVTY